MSIKKRFYWVVLYGAPLIVTALSAFAGSPMFVAILAGVVALALLEEVAR